jgi:hypothetical protein
MSRGFSSRNNAYADAAFGIDDSQDDTACHTRGDKPDFGGPSAKIKPLKSKRVVEHQLRSFKTNPMLYEITPRLGLVSFELGLTMDGTACSFGQASIFDFASADLRDIAILPAKWFRWRVIYF